ncbi:unnamed protein product [Rotaria sp. Silwood1]|nr:unnamed protein product [Rotaria sp. Silwood1]CAF5061734.1 unnamed protein product [Rotaria sp. Silwood1]
MHGLFSTTKERDVSAIFSGSGAVRGDNHSVQFEINIDSTTTNLIRPYANVKLVSANPDDEEILFFMGFVWKIVSMTETTTNHWRIVLQSCADYDSQLNEYIERYTRNCTYLSIGDILRELGDYPNASNFYERMLRESNKTDETRAHIYFNMAILEENQGAYLRALRYYRKAEKLIKLTETHDNEVSSSSPKALFSHNIYPSRMHALNNIGHIYLKDGDYKSAEEHFERALQEEPSSEVERAVVLNNFGLLEFKRGNLEKARQYFNDAIQLAQNDACSADFRVNYDMVMRRIS